jgi:type I restriction enzyme M protein
LLSNDVNLNIRRYADNAPRPEPHDLRAHLVGGIPKGEVADKADLFAAHGFNPMRVFLERDDNYYDFAESVASKKDLGNLVASDSGVASREAELTQAFETWWEANAKFIVELPETKALMAARATLLDSFVTALAPVGLLDRFQVAGAIAGWWGEIQFDLRALAAGGFGAVIDGWVTTITAALDDKKIKVNPLDHRLVRLLLPEHIDAIEAAEAQRAQLDATIKGTTSESDDEPDDEADDEEDSISAAELAALKKELTAAKKKSKALEKEFVAKLASARALLALDKEQELVLAIARSDLADHLNRYVNKHGQLVAAALENWWDKYAVTMRALEAERDVTERRLDSFLVELGYV